MIAVRLMGGLGNQLFQYAFGKSRALQHNEDLFFFTIGKINSNNLIYLKNFRTELKFLASSEKSNIYRFAEVRYLSNLERKIRKGLPWINSKLYIEKSLDFQDLQGTHATYYDGYWQSYKYFDSLSELLKREIELKDDLNLPEELFKKIISHNSVSVHIRRGDYLSGSNRNIYHTCDNDYYRKSFSAISESVPDPVFFIFSDDLLWVRQDSSFLAGFQTFFVEYPSEPDPAIELMLMKSCKHNIIANSTFSWWGAYLNQNPEKIIIAPKKWYIKSGYNNNDLLPPEWKRI